MCVGIMGLVDSYYFDNILALYIFELVLVLGLFGFGACLHDNKYILRDE